MDRNKFRYRFRNKETGKISYADTWCYGSLFQQIDMYQKDLSKMCLQGVSSDTHEIIEVIWLFNNTTIYKDGEWYGKALW